VVCGLEKKWFVICGLWFGKKKKRKKGKKIINK
jgi:hypothetical protein